MNTAVSPSELVQPSLAIDLERVTHTFPNRVRALQPVTLQVKSRELVSIIGPSGCGKSTLLRIVAGLLAPSSGNVKTTVATAAAKVGFVFQSPTLMPWTTVARNVRLPLDLRGMDESAGARKVADALRRVGLQDFAQAYPRELSGGMQMRVSIARALVTDPAILLLDEPFGALDEITREQLDQDLLTMWSERDLTVLFVTHSVQEAVFLSTRVLVMSQRPGRVVAEIAIDEPQPRIDAYRTSDRFVRVVQEVSRALRDANAT